jgi:hypothetical protein
VPKALKPELLMHADYTRKTQEVAEMRKSLEAEITKARETNQELVRASGQIAAIDEEIQRFNKIDWQRWAEQDPVECQKGMARVQMLRQHREALSDTIATKEREVVEKQREITAKQIEEGRRVLERDIPGWGPAKAKEIGDFGRTLGLSEKEISEIGDPRFVKILHLAMLGSKTQQSQTTAVKAAKTPAPAPALQKVTRPAGSKGDPLGDDTSIDAWMKAREAQLAKSRQGGRR